MAGYLLSSLFLFWRVYGPHGHVLLDRHAADVVVTAISLLLAHSVLAATDYIVPLYCPCSRTIYGL